MLKILLGCDEMSSVNQQVYQKEARELCFQVTMMTIENAMVRKHYLVRYSKVNTEDDTGVI